MANIIQHKRGTAAQWTSLNPTLAEGELGLETDTLKIKFGDGTNAWNNLSYAGTTADLSNYYTKAEVDSLLENLESDFTPIEPLEFATVTPIGGYQGWELSSSDVFTPTNNLPGVSSDQIHVNNTVSSFDDLFTNGHYIDIPFDLKNIKDLSLQAQANKYIMANLKISGFEATTRFAFVLCNNSDGVVTPIAYLYTEGQRVMGDLRNNPNNLDGTTTACIFSGSIPYTTVNNHSGSYTPGYALYVRYDVTSDGFYISFDNMSSSGDYVTNWNITDASFNLQLESVNMVRVLTYKIPGGSSTVSFNFIPSTSYFQTSDGRTDWNITDQGEPTRELRCGYDNSTITLNNNNELQVNIPQVESSLTSFADVDLSNLNNTGTSAIVHNTRSNFSPTKWYRFTVGASGSTYTMPFDGILRWTCTAPSDNVNHYPYTDVWIDNECVYSNASNYDIGMCGLIPVLQGQVVKVNYGNQATGKSALLSVYACVGNESEVQ